jgi:glycosyltransferase involved in cell wall biosynthesis
MKPLISVILPVLNGERFLADAVESILGQTFGDFELIVVDDGSKDASPKIVAEFAKLDRRVRMLRLERDPNVCSGARADNRGMQIASGAYVARMDADDIALPDRLALQLEAIQRRDLDVCGGQGEFIGGKTGPFWFPEHQDAIRHELLFRFAMPHSGLLARIVVRRDHPLDETVAADDYDWYTRNIFDLRFGNVPQTVIKVRMHAEQSSSTIGARMKRDWMRFRFRYFFRLFPAASLTDFQALNCVAENQPMSNLDELKLAGRWLARLSRPEDEKLRARMGERWRQACLQALAEEAQIAPLRVHYATQIAKGEP